MEKKLAGKNAIITGCNRGIGSALVQEFASQGCNIWACARKNSPEFESQCQKWAERYQVLIQPVYFELREEEAIKKAVQGIIHQGLPVDILINNAGVPAHGILTMTSVREMKEVYAVNVFAPVILMQNLARQMMKQKSGNIINICSVGGIEAQEGYLAYGSSKAALLWITRSVAKELAKYQIRVNALAPGLIETDMGNCKAPAEREKVLARTSLKRMGTPEEIAKAALFLASEDSSYMTGQILTIDGGRV